MRYWVDTEFHEDGKTIDLISIGIVAEDGRQYYAVSKEFNRDYAIQANPWLVDNVIAHLPEDPTDPAWKWRCDIRLDLLRFCDPRNFGKPEFWAYYADYDWVALCQLFGKMIDLPEDWPMYCMDLKQWAKMLGDPELPEQGKGEHHALADALWNRKVWGFLRNYWATDLASYQEWHTNLYLEARV